MRIYATELIIRYWNNLIAEIQYFHIEVSFRDVIGYFRDDLVGVPLVITYAGYSDSSQLS